MTKPAKKTAKKAVKKAVKPKVEAKKPAKKPVKKTAKKRTPKVNPDDVVAKTDEVFRQFLEQRRVAQQTPVQEELPEEDDFFSQLAAMDDDVPDIFDDMDDDGPMEQPRQPNEVLNEIGQMLRPSLVELKMPAPGQMWRNFQTQQVDTVLAVDRDNQGTTVSILHPGKAEPTKVSLNHFRASWEKYTPSETAANAPPQAGEVWQNIHTGFKVTINSVEQARQGPEVHSTRDGKLSRTDIRTFVANHRRVKGSSQWFVGAISALGTLKFGE